VLKHFLLLDKISLGPNIGRLALRIMVFLPLFMKHGIEKLFTFGAMSQHYLDPVHIGPVPTLVIAMISDGICSVLIMLGLFTRWAALYSFCNLFVAWSVVHHFALVTRKDQAGETIFVYMAACVALFFLGAGKFSIDALIAGSKEKRQAGTEQVRMASA
jgi:putative oxidoreductase